MRTPPDLSEQNISSTGLLSKSDLWVHKMEKLRNRSVPWCQLDSSSSLSSSSLHIGYNVGENIALKRIQLFLLLVARRFRFTSHSTYNPSRKGVLFPSTTSKRLRVSHWFWLVWLVGFCLIIPTGVRGRDGGYSLIGQGLFNMCSPLKLTRSPWTSW